MPLEGSRRRFLAFASLLVTAAGTEFARGQGSGDYSSGSAARRPTAPVETDLPEGIPRDPYANVTKDVGSWRVNSAGTMSTATIPAERADISYGGVRGARVDGSGAALTDNLPIVKKDGDPTLPAAPSSTVGAPRQRVTSRDDDGQRQFILIGGSGDLRLKYEASSKALASGGRPYGGSLHIRTTSNGQGSMPVTVLLDGQPIKSLVVRVEEDIPVSELFGERLERLVSAKSLAVTADIEGPPITIYQVDLSGIDEALKQMRVVPDYNYQVRRLGRKSVAEEFKEMQEGPPPQTNCFITTACCEIVGLPDDCFELRALRRFRDRVMLATAIGRGEVSLYYATAPSILTEMRRRGETARLRSLYFGTILPCAVMAALGLEGPTRHLYVRMMRRLAARYG